MSKSESVRIALPKQKEIARRVGAEFGDGWNDVADKIIHRLKEARK